MLWHKWCASAVLLFAGALLVGANFWFAAARSTIPLPLDAKVIGKEVRHEKHPPKDDVCLLHLGQQTLHVDRAVYDSVAIGDRLRKERWSQILYSNDEPMELAWSQDARGMMWAMPLAWSMLFATVVWVCRMGEQASQHSSRA